MWDSVLVLSGRMVRELNVTLAIHFFCYVEFSTYFEPDFAPLSYADLGVTFSVGRRSPLQRR